MTKDIEVRFKERQLAIAKERQKEFADAVIEVEASYKRYVLGQLRAMIRRLELQIVEVRTIGTALKRDWIDPDGAVAWLDEAVPPGKGGFAAENDSKTALQQEEEADVTNEICK